MLDKKTEDATVCFISTARNHDRGDKRSIMRVMQNLDSLRFGTVDLLDIDSVEKSEWLARLQAADVIYMGGGNTYHLLNSIRKSGLDKELPRLLESRIYIGDSAGSIVVTPRIDVAEIDDGDKNTVEISDTSGLGLVDFEVSPHTPEDVSHAANEEYSKTTSNKLYTYDDNTAISVIGDEISVIGDKNCLIYE